MRVIGVSIGLICFAGSSAAQSLELLVTSQAVMGVTTAPGHMQRGMPGGTLRVGAEWSGVGLFVEGTRWTSTSTFCRDGDCDYTILFGGALQRAFGQSRIGVRGGYGFVGPGRVRDHDRAFRVGATWGQRLTPVIKLRVDLQYEHWRVAGLRTGRFGEVFCCRYGNMDGAVASGGIDIVIWRR